LSYEPDHSWSGVGAQPAKKKLSPLKWTLSLGAPAVRLYNQQEDARKKAHGRAPPQEIYENWMD
jgi:hypothetical protein